MKKWVLDNWKSKSFQVGAFMFFGIIFVIFAPLLFTQKLGWGNIDFSTTGSIGDTIGGITAPIVNLISAVLVYHAFRAQIEANNLINKQFEAERQEQNLNQNRDYVSNLYASLKAEINSFNEREIRIDLSKLPPPPALKDSVNNMSNISRVLFLAMWPQAEKLNLKNWQLIMELYSTVELFNCFAEQLSKIDIRERDRLLLYTSSRFIFGRMIMPGLFPYINKTEFYTGDVAALKKIRDDIEGKFQLIESKYGFINPFTDQEPPTPPSSAQNAQ
ncbi:MAG: hypothetical protein ACKV1O_29930 [Saprospiraceae bacterium]